MRQLRNILVLAALLLAGCQKEEGLRGLPEGAIRLTAESFHGGEKTSVSGTSVQWDGNSSETVTINGNDYEVLISGNKAYIDPGTPISANSVYGYYPTNIVVSDGWETTTPTVIIPSSYDCHYTDGRQVIALPLVAYATYSSTPTTIKFCHLTAAVNVMVRNEISSDLILKLDKVVVSSSTYLLSGSTPVTLHDNDVPTVNAVGTTKTNSVTVNLTDHPTIPYSTGSDDNRIEVQIPIRPIGDGGTTPITVEVFAYEEGNPGRTFVFRKENVSVNTLRRNVMLTAGCRLNSEAGNVTEFNYLTTPLTFEAKTAGATVTFAAASGVSLEYSTDGSSWSDYSSPITLANVGDKVYFRGDNTYMSTSSTNSRFSCSKNCYIYGNIMSLLSRNNYATTTTLTSTYTFRKLFYNNTMIFSHPTKKLALPATTLTNNCYQTMFQGCTRISSAPELPATSLTNSCYYYMFDGCSGLTSTPTLPATTLANNCYQYMFRGCTGLTTTPSLPATMLTNSCYQSMFQGCTGLISITSLPATTVDEYCYDNMFQGCTSLTYVPDLPATTLATNCYSNMFDGCTSLTVAPKLPATSLASSCYISMFHGCTNLTSAPTLSATILAGSCYEKMFQDCINLTTAPDLPAPTLVTSCYSSMFNGCSSLNRIKCLATNITATNCTKNWLLSVSTTGTFSKSKKTTDWSTGSNGIPNGWTVVNAD